MKTFFLPPGYHVELVASEPMIEEPVLIDLDPQGRLWVVEMLGYMQDIAATTEREPLGRISVLEDTNGDGKMDKKTVFLDRLVLPRALKVLDRGVLVAEPPNLWLAPRHERRPARRHQGTRHQHLRPARGQRRAQRQQPALGARQLDAHVGDRRLPAAEEGRVRGAQDALARPVGRVAGRCRPHLPQLERVGAARRSRADAVLRAQSEPAANPRQLRVAPRREERSEHGVAGRGRRRASTAATRPACCGRMAGSPPTPPSARQRSTAAIASRRSSAATSSSSILPPTSSAASSSTMTARSSSRAKAYDQRRVPHVDRRALPARLPVERAGRHALPRRHVSRHHPAS